MPLGISDRDRDFLGALKSSMHLVNLAAIASACDGESRATLLVVRCQTCCHALSAVAVATKPLRAAL
jgi:hypothetical protein